MNRDAFLEMLRDPARSDRIALSTPEGEWTYAQLDRQVSRFAAELRAADVEALVSHLDNGADWIVNDLACLRAGIVHVPLPLFFTDEQVRGAVDACGADAVVASGDAAEYWQALGFERRRTSSPRAVLHALDARRRTLPVGTAKITFTSGSTGAPRGVCLGIDAMLSAANGVAQATRTLRIERHMNALPLALLLENVAGVYAALIAGTTILAPPLRMTGLQGSSGFDPAGLASAIERSGAHSLILLPQMLRAYVAYLTAARRRAPETLKLVAVGGAPAGAPLLAGARAFGVPAYEGYGLSEGASVQTLNLPSADRPGSVGRALPHAGVRIASDGEIEVSGSLFLGYLGAEPRQARWLPTGDLGHIDEAGYLHIVGRRKNVLITGFGRNVSPEWIETELRGEAAIAQAVVLGDGQPVLGAVLWPAPEADDAAIRGAVERVNRRLPDYARIGVWVRAVAAFSATSGLATANGRPRREAIAGRHPELFASSPAIALQALHETPSSP